MPPPQERLVSEEFLRQLAGPANQSVVDGMIASRQLEDETKDLAERLNFPEYRQILHVCMTQNITADDILAFLGTMTNEDGLPIDRSLDEISRPVVDKFNHEYYLGLRKLPEGETFTPKQYFDAMFRFMLVHSLGKQPKLFVAPKAEKEYRLTLPLIGFTGAVINRGASEPAVQPSLWDRVVRLTPEGRKMYYRLLLQLGNINLILVGNDQTLGLEVGDIDKKRYRRLYLEKLPGIRDFFGIASQI